MLLITHRRSGSTSTRPLLTHGHEGTGEIQREGQAPDRQYPNQRETGAPDQPSWRAPADPARTASPWPLLSDTVRPWDSLRRREGSSSMAEVLAGYRLACRLRNGPALDYPEESDSWRTPHIVSVSDNGASGGEGPTGCVSTSGGWFSNGFRVSDRNETFPRIDELGWAGVLQPVLAPGWGRGRSTLTRRWLDKKQSSTQSISLVELGITPYPGQIDNRTDPGNSIKIIRSQRWSHSSLFRLKSIDRENDRSG